MNELPWLLTLLGVAVVFDLLTSAARAAFSQAQLPNLLTYFEKEPHKAERTLEVSGKLGLRTSLRLAIAFAHLFLGALTVLVTHYFWPDLHFAWVLLIALGVLFVISIFEYFISRKVLDTPEKSAYSWHRFADFLYFVFKPMTIVMTGLLGPHAEINVPAVTDETLRDWVSLEQAEGMLEKGEREMIYSIFQFSETLTKEIMVPRMDVLALDIESTISHARQEFINAGHSRVPVYEDVIDNIVGLLYAKDLLAITDDDATIASKRKLLRTAYFVPETKKVDELLTEMQSRGVHLALVVDEYGGFAGVVTLEDIVEEIEKFGIKESQAIIDYVTARYADAYAERFVYKTADEVRESEGLQAVLGMVLWGFGDVVCAEEIGEDEECPEEAGYKFIAASGEEYDMVENFPTAEDYNREITLAYGGDLATAWETETATGNTDILNIVETEFIKIWGPKDEETGDEGVPSIAGITKLDDYTVQVVLNGFSAPAIYSVLGVSVTPLHYYGDKEQYDYENNKFGFPFGDLSKQQSLTPKPMGAGPYKFVKYENRVVVFEANEYYYRGCPKIKEIQFKETASAEVASALNTGDADAGNFSPSKTNMEEIKGYNSNGELDGDVIVMKMVDNLGYGYIGINADTVNVGGQPGSDASKNLRKAFATIYAVHRDLAVNSYYGEGASVINYPISNTSWAAPQPTDDDYQIAFSVDVDGNPIYTADMTPEDKYAAAREAALGFLEAAGFTIEDGKAVEAPEGAKLNYEVIVPGGGTGDHPAFAILTNAEADLAAIGITLNINDPANANILWDALDGGQQEMWTAAWGSTIDPDMYQVYHSSNVVGEGGTDSNHYHIRDAQLDQFIMDARMSDEQNYRKAVYKQALDVVIDWAVEIPTYQRQNANIFSTQRLNIDTLTPDITTFWGWMNDIELLEMLP